MARNGSSVHRQKAMVNIPTAQHTDTANSANPISYCMSSEILECLHLIIHASRVQRLELAVMIMWRKFSSQLAFLRTRMQHLENLICGRRVLRYDVRGQEGGGIM